MLSIMAIISGPQGPASREEALDSAGTGVRPGSRGGRLGKIRVRLLLGFGAAFLGMALFGALSYYHFGRMEDKLVFLSQADGLLNTALEVRRYEKNYFLYQHEKDYRQALDYLDQYENLLVAEKARVLSNSGSSVWRDLETYLETYRERLVRVHELMSGSAPGAADAAPARAVEELRNAGKDLIEESERLAARERQGIQVLLRDYLPLLIGFLLALAGICVLVAWVFLTRLVKPLATIEAATAVVGTGRFDTIPWRGHGDEMDSLVRAFNRMVDQLRDNNKRMVQTEKLTSLGTLTSGVAHELNNPLNNISTSCQILMEELEDLEDYHSELLKAIEEQVEKARDIVSALLAFARERDFSLAPEDLREVVQEALLLMRGELKSGVEVRVEVPGGMVVEMDKPHMVQALLNLLMNAAQAVDGKGVVTIRARWLKERGEVLLEVEDTGPGIPPKVLPRVFDPFFTTKDVGRGTGLGLSIAYGIVERHRGHISADSPAGRGALFRLTLPQKAGGR